MDYMNSPVYGMGNFWSTGIYNAYTAYYSNMMVDITIIPSPYEDPN